MSIIYNVFDDMIFSDPISFLIFAIAEEALVFLTPLQDVNLEKVGIKAVFECYVSKAGLRPEWLKGDTVIKRGVK